MEIGQIKNAFIHPLTTYGINTTERLEIRQDVAL